MTKEELIEFLSKSETESKKVIAAIELWHPIQHRELLTDLVSEILLETYDHEADQFNNGIKSETD